MPSFHGSITSMALTTRAGGLSPQLYRGSRDPEIPNPPTRTAIVGNLHDDVLLEIFDFYRQSFRDQRDSERVWNNKNGWFKLAHVCHNWRSVVLASPRRLRLRLYFAHDTPTRLAVLQSLSHLPIVVDYSNATWNINVLRCLISALRYPDRVCRIAIKGSFTYGHPAMISRALGVYFPALESLELRDLDYFETTIFSASPFMTSIQSLRNLQVDRSSRILSQVLSISTSLVDLTLNVYMISCLMDGGSIFTHLQRMPLLRNLQVSENPRVRMSFDDMKPLPPPTTTLLPELAYFRLSAGCSEIEWFVAGLVTPSLRELHISTQDAPVIPHPNLSEFIRVAGIVFFAARLTILPHASTASLFARPLLSGDPSFKMVTIDSYALARLDNASFATVEDVFLSLFDSIEFDESLSCKRLRKKFRNVKVLRLHHGQETIVADMLRTLTANRLRAEELGPDATTSTSTPINHSGSQATLDIFPSLKKIVVYARTPNMSIDEKEIASVLESFGPFTTARNRVGCTVKVFWNTYGKVPRYFIS